MRRDAKGLFWYDEEPKKGGPVREMPKIPKTGWKAPKDFPNLSSAKIIGLDTETYDPNLKTLGPGWARKDGHVVGVSIAVDKSNSWYFPIRHTIMPEDNLDPGKVFSWLKDVLITKRLKIGANIMYDIGWLWSEGVNVSGPYLDILHAEALINESRLKYNLDAVSETYLGTGKETSKLYRWCSRFYGGKATEEQRANIYRSPPRLVGPYAEMDAWAPYEIWQKQKKIIKKEKLGVVLDLECRLIPMLFEMRKRGVRIDIPQVEKIRDTLVSRENELRDKVKVLTGRSVNVYSSASIAKVFDSENIKYPRTEKGNPSFVKSWLENHPSKVANLITGIRKANKIRATFIESYLLNKNIKGRIYGEFRQLKTDEGGTVSGRLSGAHPNLQNIPVRTAEGRLVRSCFIPDEGYPNWYRGDSSQIEYRFLAHYAVGKLAKEMRRRYRNNPDTDYHEETRQLIREIAKLLLERKPTKTVNFGLVYGMGVPTLRASLGLSKKKSDTLFAAYHKGVPFVSSTFDHYQGIAQDTGIITTILGRRSRFNVYEKGWGGDLAFSYREALMKWGPDQFQRAFTHKSLNRLLQGSAADHMKKGMVDTYEAGVYDALGGVPSLTVHDELDGSWDANKPAHREAIIEMKHIMEHCLTLKVPIVVNFECGTHWGDTQELYFADQNNVLD